MGYINGQEVSSSYRFGNPEITEFPPTRDYYYVKHNGVSATGVEYIVELKYVDMDEMRSYLHKYLDKPKILGNWELMNHWIQNMWEALYNPLRLLRRADGKLGIMHGHHRFRLLDAMNSNRVWCYELVAMTNKTGKMNYPPEIRILMLKNERPPRRGTVKVTCQSCGESTKWKRKTIDRVSDVRLYCVSCGAENPYPWPGRL